MNIKKLKNLLNTNARWTLENISWLFLDKVLKMGVGLTVGVWVTRYLGPTQFGLLSFATAFVGLFSGIAGLGLQGVVVRNLVQYPESSRKIIGTSGLLLMMGGVCAYASALAIVFFIRPDDPMARLLVGIIGTTLLFKVFDLVGYWFESQVRSKYVIMAQNTIFIIFAVAKCVAIVTKASLLVFAWLVAAEALIAGLSTLFVKWMADKKLFDIEINFEYSKKLLADSWPGLFSGIAVMVYMRIDQIMLGQINGDEAVGMYSAAVRISEIWYFIPSIIASSVFPIIIKARNNDPKLYNARFQKLYDFVVFLAICVAVPLSFISNEIILFVYGNQYENAGPVLAIHIWSSVFVFLGVISYQWYLAENRLVIMLQWTFLGAVINVMLNLVLLPKYGAIGASWATVIAQCCVNLLFDCIRKETRPMFYMKARAFKLSRLIS